MIIIGEAAAASGVSAKMIRYYESIGLIPPARRTESGYRAYGDDDVHVLRFIRRARDLGFSIDAIRDLLALWRNKTRASADVKRIAQQHIAELEARIAVLQDMTGALRRLTESCYGDDRPDCPILGGLEDERGTAVNPVRRRAARH